MSIANIITFLGGLGLFLYGVTLMGDGMKLLAGSTLGKFIRKVTGSPVKALGIGAGMSAVIQSSSAVSIMAMGFVNSNLIKLKSALYIVLGSMFGTCVTGWLVAVSNSGGSWAEILSTSVIVGVIAVLGIILRKFTKSQSNHVVGDILLGCAVLLLGMSSMTNSMAPLSASEEFLSFMVQLSNPALGILIGIVFTVVVQSSAAAVATLQALAITGGLEFDVAIPVMLGITIGGALPVLISALGLNTASVRTAVAHLLFDVIGVVIVGAIFYIINAVHPFSFMTEPVSIVGVALLNTLLRLIMIIILVPMVGLIERMAVRLVKEKDTGEKAAADDLNLLEERFLDRNTTVAIEQSRLVINSMAVLVKKSLDDAADTFTEYSEAKLEKVQESEDLVDKYEDALGSYLIKISGKRLSREQNEDLYEFLHTITDLERMSDHALNLAESAREIHDKKISFSAEAERELTVLRAAVNEIVTITLEAFVSQNLDQAYRVEPLEEHIDNLCDTMKHNHIDRLQNKTCTLEYGFVFNDLLTNYERIGDHCSNIAVAMIEIDNDVFDTHEYLDSLVKMKDERFRKYLDEYTEKYRL